MNKEKVYKNHAERIYHEWDKCWRNNDLEEFLALYADNAVVESPVFFALGDTPSGVYEGKKALREIVTSVAQRKPSEIRHYYRTGYLSNDHQLIWEYPRKTPEGEQMDFVEAIDFNDQGLITYHRVYWGWRGFKVLQEDKYHNK